MHSGHWCGNYMQAFAYGRCSCPAATGGPRRDV